MEAEAVKLLFSWNGEEKEGCGNGDLPGFGFPLYIAKEVEATA